MDIFDIAIAKALSGGSGGGGGGGATPLIAEYADGYLDKTVKQIYDAYKAGSSVLFHNIEGSAEDYASLYSMRVTLEIDYNNCFAELQFGNGSMTAWGETAEELWASYPYYSD
jgi:hypothetical protein